jgi:hypothetical protein
VIRIAQLLCPQRHCFMAVAFDDAKATPTEACIELGRSATEHMARHGSSCALCGSDDFTVEVGVTRFATMAEAMPALASSMEAQLATRDYLTGPQARN